MNKKRRRSNEHTGHGYNRPHGNRRQSADRASLLGIHRRHNILPVAIAERVFEPRVGGNVYDRGIDGSECHWARVLEPPIRVVISWDISPYWQIETNHERTSEVEVRFVAEAQGRTRVELEHRNLDRHGEGWEQTRDAVAGEGGWPGCMRRFAERVAA